MTHLFAWKVDCCKWRLRVVFVSSYRQKRNAAKIISVFVDEFFYRIPLVGLNIDCIGHIVCKPRLYAPSLVGSMNDPVFLCGFYIVQKF